MKANKTGRLALCAALLLCGPAQASIVDTGTPDHTTAYVFHQTDYFAGRFTITEAAVVTSLEAYFDNSFDNGADGFVAMGIHAEAGSLPGATLFSALAPVAEDAPADWYGVAGLDWELAPGTYWATIVPEDEIHGIIYGRAPAPMDLYAGGRLGTWFNLTTAADIQNAVFGFRIGGTLSPIPEPQTYALLLAGLGLLGFAARRRLK